MKNENWIIIEALTDQDELLHFTEDTIEQIRGLRFKWVKIIGPVSVGEYQNIIYPALFDLGRRKGVVEWEYSKQ